MHFVRRGNSDAKKLLDQIFSDLRDGDRPLFVAWDLYPSPPPPVPISAQHLPRTLQDIDAEIRRLEEHLEKRLAVEREDDQRHHPRRMTIVGGALLGLVEAGSAKADGMLDTILQKIPKKERKPFDGWDRPRLPAHAARTAKEDSTSQPTGEPQSASAASPPDAPRKDEKTTAASHAGQTSTPTAAGKNKTADTRNGERATATGTSATTKHAERTETTSADTKASDPTTPVALDQGSGSAATTARPDARAKDEKAAASHAGQTVAGKSKAAADTRGGEDSTSTGTSAKNAAARGAASGSDTESEPLPFALDQGPGEA